MEKKGLVFLLKVLTPVLHLLLLVMAAFVYAYYDELYLFNGWADVAVFILIAAFSFAVLFVVRAQVKYNYMRFENIDNHKDLDAYFNVERQVDKDFLGVEYTFDDKYNSVYGKKRTRILNSGSYSGENVVTKFVKRGDFDSIEVLSDHGISLDDRNVHGETPVSISIIKKQDRILDYLLDQGVELVSASMAVKSLILSGECNYAGYIIDKGVPFDIAVITEMMGDDGNYQQHRAFISKDIDCIRFLKKQNADFKKENASGYTPIFYALYEGAFSDLEVAEVVNILSEVDVESLDFLHPNGNSALIESLLLGEMNVATALMESGVNINVIGLNGVTALIAAIKEDYVDVVEELLNKGANYKYIFDNQIVLLDMVTFSKPTVIEELIKAGLDVDYEFDDRRTLLDISISECDGAMFDVLMDNGVDVNKLDLGGRSSIFKLVVGGDKDNYYLFEHMVNQDVVDIHIIDSGDKNLLGYAILNNLYREADLLISLGVENILEERHLLDSVKASKDKDLLGLLISNHMFPSKLAVIELITEKEDGILEDIVYQEEFSDMDLKEFLIYAIHSGNLPASKVLSKMVNIDQTHAILHASLGGHDSILEILLLLTSDPLFVNTMDRILVPSDSDDGLDRVAVLDEYVNDEYGSRLDYVYRKGIEEDGLIEFTINQEQLSGDYSIEGNDTNGFSIFFQHLNSKYEPEIIMK